MIKALNEHPIFLGYAITSGMQFRLSPREPLL